MITKNMKIGEIIRLKDGVEEILIGFGMGCVGCPSAQSETLEEACEIHGLDVEKILIELNK